MFSAALFLLTQGIPSTDVAQESSWSLVRVRDNIGKTFLFFGCSAILSVAKYVIRITLRIFSGSWWA